MSGSNSSTGNQVPLPIWTAHPRPGPPPISALPTHTSEDIRVKCDAVLREQAESMIARQLASIDEHVTDSMTEFRWHGAQFRRADGGDEVNDGDV